MTNYDLIVIGGGPGGYIAAERAGGRGMKTLLIERKNLGGVCLNEGCIPSKTLLNSAKRYHYAVDSKAYGVEVAGATFSLPTAVARKRKVVNTLRKGVAFQMKRHKVQVVMGEARLIARNRVVVDETEYQAENVIIATGSEAVRIPIPGADLPQVMTNREILELEQMPRSLVVIGGGVIGLEFATFFSMLGVSVSVIEMLPEALPSFDPELASGLRRTMRGIDFHLDSRVLAIDEAGVTFSHDGKEQHVPADVVLMSVGRRPNSADLGLEALGVDLDRGMIRVNDQMQTNIPGLYAVGDVNGLSPLAHSASRMGEVAVNTIAGRADAFRRDRIPWVVYTTPEVAGVGLRQDQAEARGHQVEVCKLPVGANGRILAEHARPQGFCKLVIDRETRLILGAHLLGPYVSELIYAVVTMMEAELRVEDVRDMCFPHPTAGELIRDAIWEFPLSS